MDNTNFVDSENHINKSSMIDEHQIIEIIEKNPILPKDIGRIVCGDSNSNILTFEISISLGFYLVSVITLSASLYAFRNSSYACSSVNPCLFNANSIIKAESENAFMYFVG